MEDEILKEMKKETKLIDILKIAGCTVASIIFSIMVMNSVKHFSYKEVEATLVSYSEIVKHTESYDDCTGTFEYYVNDVKYEASISINYQYCFNGYKRTIYYDINNPEIYSKDKSIFSLILFLIFDILFIFGLLESIKELFKHSKEIDEYASKNHNFIESDTSKYEDIRSIELDSSIYGKYKLNYDPYAIDNQNNSDDRRCLEISIVKSISRHSFDFFVVFIPKDILNSVFETSKMNDVLKAYNKIESNNYNKIMKKIINQEIKTLSNWCEVPNSSEGKKMLIDNGTIKSTSIEIDKSFNLDKINFTYYYKEVGSGSLRFSYDVKTEEVESLGASR